MSLDERIDALKTRHQNLDALIAAESIRPHPDDVEIVKLKKQKLRIKDEIATLSRPTH